MKYLLFILPFIITIILIILLLLILKKQSIKNEFFVTNHKNIVCFLTVRPSELFYNFCKEMRSSNVYSNYDFYISIDDNTYTIPNYSKNDNINIIKINDKKCSEMGFKNTVLHHEVTSRDKALYYFCVNNINFNYLWLIEEDVFIPNKDALYNFDSKYTFGDLCSAKNIIKTNKVKDWHWGTVFSQTNLPLPFAKSMICAIRITKKLLNLICEYAAKNKKLFLDESLFNTLALQNNLKIVTPDELEHILWRYNFNESHIKKNYLYHPIKSIEKQQKLRKLLNY